MFSCVLEVPLHMDPLFDLEGEGRGVKSTALSPPVRVGKGHAAGCTGEQILADSMLGVTLKSVSSRIL